MFAKRKAEGRATFDHGWLDTRHTFSFGRYYDPAQMGFYSLRVINEDTVAPGRGFGRHGHENMEIFSLVLSGTLEHGDDFGNAAALQPGDFQYMSAGAGIEHSEFNPDPSAPAHFYQIWIEPNVRDTEPRYSQARVDPLNMRWQTLASGRGTPAPIAFHQNARIDFAKLDPATSLDAQIQPGDAVWVQVLSGTGQICDHAVGAGDGIAVIDEGQFRLEASGESAGGEPLQVLAFHLDASVESTDD